MLDELVPPALRDRRWLMAPLLRLAAGKHAGLLLDFKARAATMSRDELRRVYEDVAVLAAGRETDLVPAAADAVLQATLGPSVLEVGCGRGWLAERLAAAGHVTTAVDFVVPRSLPGRLPGVLFLAADIERLPFRDASFETVVCTHTLDHVRDQSAALAELRRVTRGRLILVVPCQRPYRYTFDLHLHFFPYPHSLLALTGGEGVLACEKIGPDLFYIEERAAAV